jgi:hypothetical protein
MNFSREPTFRGNGQYDYLALEMFTKHFLFLIVVCVSVAIRIKIYKNSLELDLEKLLLKIFEVS